MNPLLLILLFFLTGVLAVLGVYSLLSDLFLRDRSRISQRVDEEFRKRQRDRARKSTLFKAGVSVLPETVPEDEGKPSLRQRFQSVIEQSALNLTSQRLLLYMGGSGLLAMALVSLLAPNPLAILGAALAGLAAPYFYVLFKRKQRLDKMLTQLPDAFDLMGRVIRAGQTMSQGLQAVADEFDQPIAGEFAYCYEQQNLGLPTEMSLRDLARRTGLLEIKIFVLAVLIQQQTGGNLAEMLDKLSGTVRERFKIRGKVRSLTAEGRLQAGVLLAMPPGLFLVMLFLNRAYGQVLLDHPSILIGMLISEFLGALWIRKIVNFEF